MATPVSLIMGLGRDVGPACARRLREAGHRILVADPDEGRLDKIEEELSGDGVFHHGDLRSRIGLKNCFAAAEESYGRVDNLILIPPIPESGGLDELDMTAFDKIIQATVRASALTLHLFQAAITDQEDEAVTSMDRRRQKGSVTFVLSLTARLAEPGRFLENATQAALAGLVQASAIDLAASGIRCNAISAVRPRAEENETWLKKRTPLKRTAMADEIANAAHFLASPQSAIITGETLVLDGGRSTLGGLLGG